jgi:hypothetical protein
LLHSSYTPRFPTQIAGVMTKCVKPFRHSVRLGAKSSRSTNQNAPLDDLVLLVAMCLSGFTHSVMFPWPDRVVGAMLTQNLSWMTWPAHFLDPIRWWVQC